MLMASSALAMLSAGLVGSFLPQELLTYLSAEVSTATVVLVQITGAVYLGFAALNWYARGILIGGIYARPVAMGNLLHFAIGAVTLTKLLLNRTGPELAALTAVYVLFAVWFGRVVFTHPGSKQR